MRDSTLTALRMPGLGDALFVDHDETPDFVRVGCAVTGIPGHREGHQPALSLKTNMHVHRFVAIEAVEEKPVSSWNAFNTWHVRHAPHLMMSSRCTPAKHEGVLDRRVQTCSGHHISAEPNRGAQALSMPGGRAPRGRSRTRQAERIDGAEHRVTLSNVMAGVIQHTSAASTLESRAGGSRVVCGRAMPRPQSCARWSLTMKLVAGSAGGAFVLTLSGRGQSIHRQPNHGVSDPADPRLGSERRARGGVAHAMVWVLSIISRITAGGSTRRPIAMTTPRIFVTLSELLPVTATFTTPRR